MTDPKHDPLRRPAIFALLALSLLSAAVLVCRPALQREHHKLVLLRNQIEAAAAPDEPVIVTDPLLAHFLRWKGSPALCRQLYPSQSGSLPTPQPQEVILVTSDRDPLLNNLRAAGYLLTPDISQSLSIDRGNGVQLLRGGVIRIYFAVHAVSSNEVRYQP